MSTLPRISGRECIKALEKVGFQFKRQEGSHIMLRRTDPFHSVLFLIIKSLIGERSERLSGKRA
jgi:predicted RNA binding protein YcfA (HicA-like mRNA interferase family)